MDEQQMRKQIKTWAYTWAKKLFEALPDRSEPTEEFLGKANALIGEQPESHRDNYAAALMQAVNAYYQFLLNGGETDSQKYSMELFEKSIQNIFKQPTIRRRNGGNDENRYYQKN